MIQPTKYAALCKTMSSLGKAADGSHNVSTREVLTHRLGLVFSRDPCRFNRRAGTDTSKMKMEKVKFAYFKARI